MPDFRNKGGILQKLPKVVRVARKVQGSINFDLGIQSKKTN